MVFLHYSQQYFRIRSINCSLDYSVLRCLVKSPFITTNLKDPTHYVLSSNRNFTRMYSNQKHDQFSNVKIGTNSTGTINRIFLFYKFFNRNVFHYHSKGHRVSTRILRHTSYNGYYSLREYCSFDSNSKKTKDDFYKKLIGRLGTLEDQTRIRGYSTIRMGLIVLLITGLSVYAFREYIRDNVAGEVSNVAYKSLGDEAVREKAQELAVALLYTIFNNPDMQVQAVNFLGEIVKRPEAQKALSNLLINVVNDKNTINSLTQLLKKVFQNSLEDEHFRVHLTANLKLLLKDDNTKQGLLELFQFILNDSRVIDSAKGFVSEVMNSKRITTEATKLGKTVLAGVVEDPSIQKSTGDGIWSAIGYSVTPNWFSRGTPTPSDTEVTSDHVSEGTENITEKDKKDKS